MKKKTNPDLEATFEQLETIVKRLESGEESLEATLKLFEEGSALVASCQKILDEAEQKIELLSSSLPAEEGDR
ncbi:MAG: exodeoxyribonuclease VII small subunit [FCB group bacterium]|nr:exodeoxyribonuclease VII small subunit [FCB group bacterium]